MSAIYQGMTVVSRKSTCVFLNEISLIFEKTIDGKTIAIHNVYLVDIFIYLFLFIYFFTNEENESFISRKEQSTQFILSEKF